jgi:molybdopterin/thiamine biosynthesis adenylyltransferase
MQKKKQSTCQQQHNVRSGSGFSTERLSGSVDTALISRSHIVVVGVGGAYGICEDLVRTGIGKLTIIDFDVVSDTNLATQGYYIDDIGKPKVDALSNTLRRINPSIQVIPVNKNFLEISEIEVTDIISDASLLLMMTDDFNAQKRGNLFSLKYKIPAIFAIMYEKARGAEITFNIPGITPACHRCAVSPRYKQYDMGYQNIVTSQGSNSFQTHYLNSVIGMIALSILHIKSENVEFSKWYGNRWERNLVQLRINPNYENRLFKEINNPRAFNFDSVWQKIEEEKPPKYNYTCPDCGGHGDLLKNVITQPI